MTASFSDLSLAATSGRTLALSDYQGRHLLVYFYPRDNTPGCTQEGQEFAEAYSEFQALGIDILGVSRDTLKSHEHFKSKLELPFDLVSDTDETLCQAFDVIKAKQMYGKPVRGIERSTFLLDPDGQIAKEWRKVSVKGHVQAVLQTIRELINGPGA